MFPEIERQQHIHYLDNVLFRYLQEHLKALLAK